MVIFNSDTKLDTSMESHQCHICEKIFSCRRSLILHSKTHSQDRKEKTTEQYVCTTCGKVAKTKQALERHAAYHESDRPYSCDVCLQRFKNTDDRGKHYRRLKRDGKFEHACQVCHKHFKSNDLLKKHLVMLGCEKGKSKVDTSDGAVNEEIYEMDDDCVVIKDADDVGEAETVHCTCKTCGQEFEYAELLKKHYREFHKDKKKHVCLQCGQTLSSKDSLTRHYSIFHQSAHPYECEICKAKFKIKESLCRHVKFVHKDGGYECDICHKKFSQPVNLKKHMAVHSTEKEFVCGVCGKEFRWKQAIQKHLSMHKNNIDDKNRKDFIHRKVIDDKHEEFHTEGELVRPDVESSEAVAEKMGDVVVEMSVLGSESDGNDGNDRDNAEDNEGDNGAEDDDSNRDIIEIQMNENNDIVGINGDKYNDIIETKGGNYNDIIETKGDKYNDIIETKGGKYNDIIETKRGKYNDIIETKGDKYNDIIDTKEGKVSKTGSKMDSSGLITAIEDNSYDEGTGVNVNEVSEENHTAFVDNEVMIVTYKRKMQSVAFYSNTNKRSRHHDNDITEPANSHNLVRDMQSMNDGTDGRRHGTDGRLHGTDNTLHGTDGRLHGTDGRLHGTDARLHATATEGKINASEGDVLVGRKVELVIESQANTSSTITATNKLPIPSNEVDKLPVPSNEVKCLGNKTNPGAPKQHHAKRQAIMKALKINTDWAIPKTCVERNHNFSVASVARKTAQRSQGLFTSSLPASPDSSSHHGNTRTSNHKVHVFRPSSIRHIMGSASDHVDKADKESKISAFTVPNGDPLSIGRIKESETLKQKKTITKVDTPSPPPDIHGKFSLVKHMLSLQTEELFDKTLFDNPLYNRPAHIKDFKKMVAMHTVSDDSGRAKRFDLSAKQNIPFQWLGLSNAKAKESGGKCISVRGQSDHSENITASVSETEGNVAAVKDIRSASSSNSDSNSTVPLMPYVPTTSIPAPAANIPNRPEQCAKSFEDVLNRNNFNDSHGSANRESVAASAEYRPGITSRFEAMRSMVQHSQGRRNNERNSGSLGGISRLTQYQSVLRNPFEITSAVVKEFKSVNSSRCNTFDKQLYRGQSHFTSSIESMDAYTSSSSSSNSGQCSPSSSVPVSSAMFSAHTPTGPTSTTISPQEIRKPSFLQRYDWEASTEPRNHDYGTAEPCNRDYGTVGNVDFACSQPDQSCWNTTTPHVENENVDLSYQCI